MKITKQGIVPGQREWAGSCATCNSEAEAKESEMTHIKDDIREGGRFSWEVCPVCGSGNESGYGGMLFYPSKASS
jgi:hypothetical protein